MHHSAVQKRENQLLYRWREHFAYAPDSINYLEGAKTRRLHHLSFNIVLFLFFLIGLSSISITPSFAQTKVLIKDAFFEIDAKKAIDSLYNRNADAAQELLEPWREKHPNHPLWLLWDGMEVWWNVLEDLDDHSLDREFIARMQQADYEAGRILRSEPGHPDALIIRSVANGYIARLHANREEWLTSMQFGKNAYQAHQELLQVAPNLTDNHFAEGMKLYYAAYIPEAYPVVKAVSWFFPEGDKQKGLEELQYAARNAVFARAEAKYFLANILHHYENEYDQAKQNFAELIESYPDNSYYRREHLQTLSQLDQYEEILAFSSETLEYWESKPEKINPVLESEVKFWIGRAFYYHGNFAEAKPYLIESVEISQGLVNHEDREVYVLAAYFAGRTHERLRENGQAKKYYRIAADQKTVPEARKRSRELLKDL